MDPRRAVVARCRRHRLTAAAAVLTLTVTGLAAPAAAAPEAAPQTAPTAAAADGDGVFRFAVLPDTQQEVLNGTKDTRFTNRIQWLVDHKAPLDLRYVSSSGDVVGWDTADHAQYKLTTPGVKLLDASGVPWSFSVGNHDTAAVGPGGSARPGGNASIDVRNTTTFNAYYGVTHADALVNSYKPNKIDNSYSMFTAEGTRWLILNIELWPRTEVVAWAQRVVAKYPGYNVAVVTHAMLNADGSVQQNNGGYGANSPQYLLDNLVLKYRNVRFVFSGHAGSFGLRDLTGVNGNPVSLIQTTYHSNTDNPVRIVTVETTNNRYSSVVYAPYSRTNYTDGSASSRSGMAWIR